MAKRFQFSLADLVAVVFVTGLCATLTRLFFRGQFADAFPEHPELFTAIALVTATLTGIATLGLLHRGNTRQPVRWFTLIVVVGLVWGAACLFGAAALQQRMHLRELVAQQSLRRFAEAQEIYHRTDWDSDGVLEYATSLRELCDRGLLPAQYATAEGQPGTAQPVDGYCFKVLTRGRVAKNRDEIEFREFIVNGKMTRGYGLLAYPAVYGASGVYCFKINSQGWLFSLDYGVWTDAIVAKEADVGFVLQRGQ
ncbi:MAG: DUF2950 family protein [Planctomycetota bacterium]|nr:DUF2950 family protein [Planctomycetota bacterium]